MGNVNRTVHNAAVQCLLQFNLESARRDALLPLLPWLAHPKWADEESTSDRLRLIQSLGEVIIHESVPDLIWLFLNDECESNHQYAAESLMAYKDPRISQSLLAALAGGKIIESQKLVILRLIINNDPSFDAEIVDCLIEFVKTGKIDIAMQKTAFCLKALGVRKALEEYLAEISGSWNFYECRPGLALELIGRLEGLDAADPKLAASLHRIAYGWKGAEIDRFMVRRFSRHSVDTDLLMAMIQHRETIARDFKPDLIALKKKGGIHEGFVLVLTDDRAGINGILASSDSEAQKALLAATRLTGNPLPLNPVKKLLYSSDQHLAQAAECYLESAGSITANEILYAYALSKGQGAVRPLKSSWHLPLEIHYSWLVQFRREMQQATGPEEIIALLSGGPGGGNTQMVIRIYSGKPILYQYEEDAETIQRNLCPKEWKMVMNFIKEKKVDFLSPYFTYETDVKEYGFLHLTKKGHWIVDMEDPRSGSVYEMTINLFQKLKKND